MNRTRTRELLRRERLAPHKKLGQNFLVHGHTAERIVALAGIGSSDTVIEVGVGLGALTRPLAAAAGQVIGIEADSGIVRLHREQDDLPDNVRLIHGDILKTDLAELARETGGRLQIVANLPYSISTPFLFRLYEQADHLAQAVIMLQKEVALRLAAKPGTKAYGVPTVLLNGCADCEILMQVKPEEFHPRPKVDSSVVRLRFFPVPQRIKQLDTFRPEALRRVVSAAFGQRRKTLANALGSLPGAPSRKELAAIIEGCGLSPSVRAERLKVQDFIRLTNHLWPRLQSGTPAPDSG